MKTWSFERLAILGVFALLVIVAARHVEPVAGRLAEGTGPASQTKLYATGDARISQGAPTTNYNGQQMVVGFSAGASADLSLVQFDLSSLPAGVTILTGTLRIYVRDTSGTMPQTVSLRRVTGSWNESTVTWNTQPSSVAIGGSTSVGGVGWATWDVTGQVQKWYSGVDANNGLKLVGPAQASYGVYLASKEVTPVPELIIAYEQLPTFTPRPTFTASATLTPLPTSTGGATSTPTPTSTAGASLTPTPSATGTVQPTPTGLPDLGDAPDSSNSHGLGMNAYPGIPAHFPSVFSAGSPPYGPLHHNAKLLFHLGDNITREEEADAGVDADGVHNIDPVANHADQDLGDDGLGATPSFPHCHTTTMAYNVRVYTGAPATAYVNVWADWDRNGQWGETPSCGGTNAPEWAVQNQAITLPGPSYHSFYTPAFLVYNFDPTKDIWLRITISEKPLPVPQARNGSGPTTGFDFGETEDYHIAGVPNSPTPSVTPTYTPSPTLTPTPTVTPTPTATPTPVPDLGDAPDSSNNLGDTMDAYSGVIGQFPTVFGTGSPPYGPIHHNDPLRFYLGEGISGEEEADMGYDEDGINNIGQSGADKDRMDDGLQLPDTFPDCQYTNMDYTVSVRDSSAYGTKAYLNVWLDFNRNGEWGDSMNCGGGPFSEWAVQNHVITLGSHYATFTTPYFLVYNADYNKDMWVRISLSESPASNADGSGPAGGWADGETEDYLWTAPPDFEVTGMEVSQGTQNLANEMPLVEDRRTIVRVYAQQATGTAVGGVNARLYGTRGGSSLSGSPIDAENNPVTIQADGGDRTNLNDSFWFYLPSDWRSGDVTLRAEVNYDDAVTEYDKDDNEIETDVSFEATDSLNMAMVPLHLHEDADRDKSTHIYWCTESDCDEIYDDLLRFHPIADLNLWRFTTSLKPIWHGWPVHKEWDPNDDSDRSAILNRLKWKRTWTNDPVSDMHYYGMVHETFAARGLADTPGWVALGTMDSDFWTASPWHGWGPETMAHELGHNQGLQHVACADDDGDGTPDEEEGGATDSSYPWPYPDCSLAVVDTEGYYGLDVYYSSWGLSEPEVISNDPGESQPHLGYPLMGYESPNWVSPWEYCNLLEEYGITCSLTWSAAADNRVTRPSTEALRIVAALQSATEYLLAGGTANANQETATLDPAYRLSQPPPQELEERVQTLLAGAQAPPPASGWLFTLEDAASHPLYTETIAFNEDFHNGALITSFASVIPFPAGTQWLRIRHGPTVIAERQVSAHAPTVHLLSPNGGEQMQIGSLLQWTGSDADGDDLLYTLLYSTDAGATWRALVLDTGETSLTVDENILADMLGSNQALLKVIASDGVNTGEDVSDAVFSVPGSAPLSVITSPQDGTFSAPGKLVVLEGVGLDMEEGTLRGNALQWTSDRDGALGTGEELALHNLSTGHHRITLTATDSDGMSGQAAVDIVIGYATEHVYLPALMR